MDVAIIGFSFNIPGCRNIDDFIGLLESGNDALKNNGDLNNKITRAGYISGHEEFDYELLGISLRDSLIIEPQQRLFIQQVWKALELAGYNPKKISRTVGVYSSSSDSNYAILDKQDCLPSNKYDPFEIEIGKNKEQQSLRTSFLLDLKGPAVGIQSACSSGLMSVHVAIQGLITGDCDVAIAGGSCLPYPLHSGYEYKVGMNMSKSGYISAYDEKADGMVPGFGSVVLVLKEYDEACRDRDHK
ncbi:polyketide synthase [Endozoicomonas sp. Mp262]|uniref:beta-ketoacyl [acyl carrier protein] synthase domain-containing protein n=1 Tax=Endozoicomonas sp. Mp262 TaxID=2919499 RepID=UPI0021DA22F6